MKWKWVGEADYNPIRDWVFNADAGWSCECGNMRQFADTYAIGHPGSPAEPRQRWKKAIFMYKIYFSIKTIFNTVVGISVDHLGRSSCSKRYDRDSFDLVSGKQEVEGIV